MKNNALGYLARNLLVQDGTTRDWLAPRPAGAGATIGLFSPSEPISVGNRRERVHTCEQMLIDNGFRVKYGKNAWNHDAYTAGSVKERLADFHELVRDDDVDMLMATWGGKSCNQLLDGVDFDEVRKAGKPMTAFSDGCVLVNAIAFGTGLFAFSGPNVVGKLDETTHLDLEPMVSGKMPTNVFGSEAAREWRALGPGSGTGRLIGGNLSTFVLGLVGTTFLPRDCDLIFFWEVLDMRPQLIDQHLICLRNAGFFEQVRGMVIGDLDFREETEWKRSPGRSTE